MRTNLKPYLVAAGVVAIAGLAALACESRRPLGPNPGGSDIGPVFDRKDHGPMGIVGAGMILSPPSLPKQHHQIFGIDIRDRNLDRVPEGDLVFEDKNPANRLNGKPLRLRSVSWTTISALNGCADGGVQAGGVLVITNTNELQTFHLIVCDDGEPGKDHDIFLLEVFRGDESRRFIWRGRLVAGNVQAHGVVPTVPTPTTGDVDVTTRTTSSTGSDLDSDGYTITLDGTPIATIGTNATVRLGGLAPGEHQVGLDGVATNCTVAGDNPRTVSVFAGMITSVTFDVSCGATTASLSG